MKSKDDALFLHNFVSPNIHKSYSFHLLLFLEAKLIFNYIAVTDSLTPSPTDISLKRPNCLVQTDGLLLIVEKNRFLKEYTNVTFYISLLEKRGILFLLNSV